MEPTRVIKGNTSITLPKEVDLESSKTTVFVAKNIVKTKRNLSLNDDGEEQDCYVYDLEFYPKQEYLAEMVQKGTISNIDPIIDPTADLTDIISKKAKILGNRCTEKIESGFQLKIGDKVQYFSLSSFDQMNIDTQLGNILNLQMDKVAYHSDDNYCTEYTASDFIRIAATAKFIILKETTYANFLITHLKKMKDIDSIMSLQYGDALTKTEKKNFDNIIKSQSEQFVAAIKDKTGIDISDIVTELIG